MSEKKSYGSCRAKYARRENDQQYLDISANEAARLIVALQNVVGKVIASERRGNESDIIPKGRLSRVSTNWSHSTRSTNRVDNASPLSALP